MYINGDGQIVYRSKGSKPAAALIEDGKAALDNNNVGALRKRFKKGYRDDQFLRLYGQSLFDAGINRELGEIVELYVKQFGKNSLQDPQISNFFFRGILDVDGELINILGEDKTVLEKMGGENFYNQKLDEAWKDGGIKFIQVGSASSFDEKGLKKYVAKMNKHKYEKAGQVELNVKLQAYLMNHDWQNLVDLLSQNMQNVSAEDLYLYCYMVSKRCDDKKYHKLIAKCIDEVADREKKHYDELIKQNKAGDRKLHYPDMLKKIQKTLNKD